MVKIKTQAQYDKLKDSTGGFYKNPELASRAGKLGGLKSKRKKRNDPSN
jgi:general stress protein YciG